MTPVPFKTPCLIRVRAKKTYHDQELETPNSPYNTQETRSSISPSLTNRTTQLICDLIASLEVSDLRYSLRTYAAYFECIPRRIGANRALDTSVDAFTSAFTSFRTGTQQRTAMKKHGQALQALRESLYDPITTHSSATLCAVHLLWISQVRTRDRVVISKLLTFVSYGLEIVKPAMPKEWHGF